MIADFRLLSTSLRYRDNPVGGRPDMIDLTAGPAHFDVRFRCCSETEVHTQITLGNITAAAANFIHLPVSAGGNAVHARSDAGAVRLYSDSLHLDPVGL